jgi:CheY-like chemotaxis protein
VRPDLAIHDDEFCFGWREVNDMSLRYRRPLILVVDEDERLATVLRSVVAQEGFGVVNAPNGKAALERVRAMHELPRLIILEPDTPVMSGSVLLAELARDSRFAGIPVVLLSREPRDLRDPSGNVVANFAKPIPVEELKSLVKKHARTSRAVVAPP